MGQIFGFQKGGELVVIHWMSQARQGTGRRNHDMNARLVTKPKEIKYLIHP